MLRSAFWAVTAILITGLAAVPVVNACTAFLASGEGGVLFGNNEDFWNPATRMWFVPGGEGRYGAVYFGFDNLSPQGGMNEAGLAFDGFATRPKPVTESLENEVVIDLSEELEKGPHVVDLPSVFPRNSAYEAFVTEQEEAVERRRRKRGSVELQADALERFSGIYRGPYGALEIEVADGALVVAAFGPSPLRLAPTSETQFFEATLMMDYEITFRIGDNGEVIGADVRILRDDFTMAELSIERRK